MSNAVMNGPGSQLKEAVQARIRDADLCRHLWLRHQQLHAECGLWTLCLHPAHGMPGRESVRHVPRWLRRGRDLPVHLYQSHADLHRQRLRPLYHQCPVREW
jgi:hypothetical protein